MAPHKHDRTTDHEKKRVAGRRDDEVSDDGSAGAVATEYVSDRRAFSCDGDGGHPTVYFTSRPGGSVSRCPYCGANFKHVDKIRRN